ncbi:MAG: RtcB family protein [Oligoflexia bacterium]|nr:RtcB family protein [Oligoflexia bacterium]
MIQEITNTRIPIKIWASDLENSALEQAINVTKIPVAIHHVALMADAHTGKGSTIGSVIALNKAIIPSAVGVDIGCGMIALKLPFKIDQFTKDIKHLRHSFERSIPLGRNGNRDVSNAVTTKFNQLGLPRIFKEHNNNNNKEMKNALHQVGSLGGGNHFIELMYDSENSAWLMIHSGSRHIGLVIAEKYIEKAKKLKQVEVPDPLLSCLVEGTNEFNDYIHDLNWALNYASMNREEMLNRLIKDVSFFIYKDARLVEAKATNKASDNFFQVNCHHNFASLENHFGTQVWLIRKGAVSAKENELAIIPGSMGTKSYIVKGKGNPQSFCSSSHGAGRKLSRTEAFKTFNENDIEKQTKGIECRKDRSIIDELPSAYKNIDVVMANQSDLVEKLYELKQIMCVKGGKD